MGHFTQKGTCRAVTRSPVDFREGRRASDGLVAQGILSQVDNPLNCVAFNSQRLHEACKAKGVLELHLLQQEAAQLTSQYQSSVPPDEMCVRQMQHSQFHVTPIKATGDLNSLTNGNGGGCNNGYKTGAQDNSSYFNKTVSGLTSDINSYVGMMKSDFAKHDNGDLSGMKHITMKTDAQQASSSSSPSALQKPPLQQQLMQHRLLQQKRQILQKQGAMETGLNGLSRRQMLRQQSYKIAQTQQILPPLPYPLSESESEDLLAFQQIVENPNSSCSPSSSLMSSPKFLKTTHLHNNNSQPSSLSPSLSPQPNQSSDTTGIWNNLSNNLQSSCQISDATANTHDLFHQPLYHQVYYYR